MRLQQFPTAFQVSDPDPVRTHATQQAVQWSQLLYHFLKLKLFKYLKIFKLSKQYIVNYYTYNRRTPS